MGSRLLAAALGAAAFVLTTTVDVASAHDGRHPYESVVTGVTPVRFADSVSVRVIDDDAQIEVAATGRAVVIVRGYSGEAFVRIAPTGAVDVNLRSPSLAPSSDRMGTTPSTGTEDALAAPRWERVGSSGRYRWFDRRIQYRATGVPAAVSDPAKRTKLWDYRIPMTVGGDEAVISGSLYWVGRTPFPSGLFVVMLVVTAGCLVFAAGAMRRISGHSGDGAAASVREGRHHQIDVEHDDDRGEK